MPPEEMNAEDPLFILYHQRLDGKAERRAAHERRLHSLCGTDAPHVFDYHDGDIYWCTADVGWVTGHSYIVYGPLGERRHHADVRRRAQPPYPLALLGK